MNVAQRQAKPGVGSLAGEPRPGRGRPVATLALLLTAWLAGAAWLGGAAGIGVASAASPADKGGGSGERPPSRLRLVRPVGGLVPGRPDSLRIETIGERGQLLPAQHPLVVVLSGANGLTSTTRVTVPTGATEVEVPIVAAKPGLWQLEVRSDGLYSTSTVITSVAEALAQRHKALAASALRTPAAPAAAPAAAGRIAAPGHAGVTTGTAPTREARAPAPAANAPAKTPATAVAAGASAAGPPGARLEVERLRVAPPAATAPPPAPPRIARFARRPMAAPNLAEAPAATAARSRAATPLSPAPMQPSTAPASPSTAPAPPSTGPASRSTPPASRATGAAPASAAPASTAAAAAGGEVRLIPEKLERHRGPQGWEDVKIAAYWFEKGVPSPVSHDLRLALVSDEGNLTIAPVSLQIPSGDFESNQQAVVNVASPATASLQALYPGGQSNRVQMSFLAAPAARLAFTSGSQVIPALGVASSEVYVRLLDAAGEPAVASQPIRVDLQLSGPLGSPLLPPAVIDTGAIETRVPLELPRFGAYTVLASAANLAPTAPLPIQVTFDWLLLLATLLGGILGSVTRLLSQGQSGAAAPRRLLRVLLLGGLAALLVVLMSAFGLLSLLTGALPQGWSQALARVPLGSLTGVFLLGFLAGLLFDRIFGGLLSPGGPDAKRAPASP